MFARLRMFLKQCSLVQPCTAGFGWHGRQWVKQNMYVMKEKMSLKGECNAKRGRQ